MLPAYKAFVGVFLDCPYSRFYLHTVDVGRRTTDWKNFGKNGEERFFKSYYVFLRLSMYTSCRYYVYVDDKPGKRYRWKKVEIAINRAARRDYSLHSRQVARLVPLDSKECQLLQVTDIVLGALTSEATSEHKRELARHIRGRLEEMPARKLSIREWSPDLKR